MSLIEVDWNPDTTKLRHFSLVSLLGFGLLGIILAWRLGCFIGMYEWTLPVVIWVFAACIGLTGLILPNVVRPVYIAWMGLAYPLGWIVGHLFLGLVFFGIFAPIALLFRIIGRDPLQRGSRSATSYWITRTRTPRKKRYFQQF